MKDSIGVIVGRFQVPNPHFGHFELINFVASRHEEIVIFIGVSPLKFTKHDPLTFKIREEMLRDYLNNMELPGRYRIIPVEDCRQDNQWSDHLDYLIDQVAKGSEVCLYGSRASFLTSYIGKYPTCEFPEVDTYSGTQIRRFHGTPEGFWRTTSAQRVGIIHATQNQFPIVYSTVDIAVISKDQTVLLGRKANETSWQFIGGFVDTMDQTLKAAAARELAEETGIIVLRDHLQYIDSTQINDWRYRGQSDKVMTHLFMLILNNKAETINIKANDDIEELAWFSLEEAQVKLIIEHLPLYDLLEKKLCSK